MNNNKLDELYNRVEMMETIIEFLRNEIKKHGETPELKSRILKEITELKKISKELDDFLKDSDLTDGKESDTL